MGSPALLPSDPRQQAAYLALINNEVSGRTALAYDVTPPSGPIAGWQVGWNQFDLKKNSAALGVLASALAASGFFDATGASEVAAAYKADGSLKTGPDLSSIVDLQGDPVDAGTVRDALATPAAKAIIDQRSLDYFNSLWTSASTVAASNTLLPGAKALFSDPAAGQLGLTVLVDVANQFGTSILPGIQGFLTSGSHTFKNGVVVNLDQSSPDAAVQSLIQYVWDTKQDSATLGGALDGCRRLGNDFAESAAYDATQGIAIPIKVDFFDNQKGSCGIATDGSGAVFANYSSSKIKVIGTVNVDASGLLNTESSTTDSANGTSTVETTASQGPVADETQNFSQAGGQGSLLATVLTLSPVSLGTSGVYNFVANSVPIVLDYLSSETVTSVLGANGSDKVTVVPSAFGNPIQNLNISSTGIDVIGRTTSFLDTLPSSAVLIDSAGGLSLTSRSTSYGADNITFGANGTDTYALNGASFTFDNNALKSASYVNGTTDFGIAKNESITWNPTTGQSGLLVTNSNGTQFTDQLGMVTTGDNLIVNGSLIVNDNVAGQTTDSVQLNKDGSQAVTSYDMTGGSWLDQVSTYNRLGYLAQSQTNNTDGGSVNDYYIPSVSDPLASQVTENADGSGSVAWNDKVSGDSLTFQPDPNQPIYDQIEVEANALFDSLNAEGDGTINYDPAIANPPKTKASIASNSIITLNYSNLVLTAGSVDNLTIHGSNNHVVANAGDVINISSPLPADINFTVSDVSMNNGSVNVLDNSRVDVLGSQNSVTYGQNDQEGVVGNQNNITVGYNGDIAVTGSGNNLNCLGNGSIVLLHGGSNTVSGVREDLYLDPSTIVATSNNTATLYASSSYNDYTINGSFNSIAFQNGSYVSTSADSITVSGQYNNINVNNTTVYLVGANGYTNRVNGSGDIIKYVSSSAIPSMRDPNIIPAASSLGQGGIDSNKPDSADPASADSIHGLGFPGRTTSSVITAVASTLAYSAPAALSAPGPIASLPRSSTSTSMSAYIADRNMELTRAMAMFGVTSSSAELASIGVVQPYIASVSANPVLRHMY